MSYKNPGQMLEYIINNSLLTDACMTIIDGRNEYGFHAIKVPESSINRITKTAYMIKIVDGKDILSVPVTIPDNGKPSSIWLISFEKGKYEALCVQHETKENLTEKEIEKKEYLSVIALFLDHYKVGTRTKLLGILKYGYAQLKKEIGDDNPYELLKDYMDESYVLLKSKNMPDKYGIRFNFELFNHSGGNDK